MEDIAPNSKALDCMTTFIPAEINELHQAFTPEEHDIKETIIKKKSKKALFIRYIYEGNDCKYSKEETELGESFRAFFIQKFKKDHPKLVDEINQAPSSFLLRFVYGSKSDEHHESAAESLKECFLKKHLLYKKDMTINATHLDIYNTGAIYVFGRDIALRPILHIHFIKWYELMKKYDFESLKDSIFIFLNYVINNLLIPGKIENWVTIYNFDHIGHSKMKKLKKLIKCLHFNKANYSRIYRAYNFHVGMTINMSLRSSRSKKGTRHKYKTKIINSKKTDKLWEHISKSQVQKEFGGFVENLHEEFLFFPPKCPSNNYRHSYTE